MLNSLPSPVPCIFPATPAACVESRGYAGGPNELGSSIIGDDAGVQVPRCEIGTDCTDCGLTVRCKYLPPCFSRHSPPLALCWRLFAAVINETHGHILGFRGELWFPPFQVLRIHHCSSYPHRAEGTFKLVRIEESQLGCCALGTVYERHA